MTLTSAVSQYSVIQYVPDPIRDERVNIGVVLICPDLRFADARITTSLRRARQLAPDRDVTFLSAVRRDLERTLEEFASSGTQPSLPWHPPEQAAELLRSMSGQFANSVQLTAPRGALHPDPAALLDRLHAQYVGAASAKPRAADRRRVRRAVRRELEIVGLGALIRTDLRVEGKHDEYAFDIGLVNGSPKQLVTAMSLVKDDKAAVRNDLYSHAWQFEDVRDAGFRGSIALVAHATQGRMDLIKLGKSIMRDMGGELVELPEAKQWAELVAIRIAAAP